MRVDQLAEELAIHPNTVRFHLETLEADGAVERTEQRSGGRGRPSAVYAAAPAATGTDRRDPVLLSRILIEGAASRAANGARAEVWEAGRRWGKEQPADADPGHDADPRDDADPGAVREVILRHLEETGFEPGAQRGEDDGSGRVRIPLFNCPFADLVDSHQESVCALHAGMLEGVRQAVDPDHSWNVELRPFVTPSVCEVTVCGQGAAAGER